MRLLSVALFGMAMNGCVIYEGYGDCGSCGWGDWDDDLCEGDCDDWSDWCDEDCDDEDECEPCDDDEPDDTGIEDTEDTEDTGDEDECVAVDFILAPGEADQGETLITTMAPDATFDMTQVVDITFFGDLTIDTFQPRADEVLIVLTVDCDAAVGYVDALVELEDGCFEILEDVFLINEKIVDTGEECECP